METKILQLTMETSENVMRVKSRIFNDKKYSNPVSLARAKSISKALTIRKAADEYSDLSD